MAFNIKKIFGDSSSRAVKGFQPKVLEINALEEKMLVLKDEDFPAKTLEFKSRIENGESLDSLLSEAFALVREASRRTLGQRHYDVQLIGGMALHSGKITEMRTGEGKTLVATLPTYLNALSGKGAHVVTVNDYLARRDAVWMGQIYSMLGLSVGVVNSLNTSFIYDPKHIPVGEDEKDLDKKVDQLGSFRVVYEFLRPCSRKQAYSADITYGTNNEFGFDYLKDNLANSLEGVVQRGHSYAIVDEVDSILIDESRTPLIISSESGDSEKIYTEFADLAKKMKKDDDYKVDEKLKAITLTDSGITKAEQFLGVGNIYTEKGIKYVHHLETAVRAQALFLKDKDYVVKEGEVIIVDPFTGRLQPGRRWSEGLHQAIEAKEGAKIEKETRAVASITFQNYFRFYKKLSGMTGTAETSAEEFFKVYGLDVIKIPTNKPIRRVDHNDFIFQTEKGKFQAIAKRVKELNQKGQPVLIGTISIERNELLSAYLKQEGVAHSLLNAKNHEKEAEIIAQAGKKGSVVIATNMAGRGIDISLGGNPCTKEEAEEVRNIGGLFVLGTERHEARRIDNQLRGRAGRQGDPGETQFYVSLEDDLMRVFGSDSMKKMMGRFGIPEDQPIQNGIITKALEGSQAKIEGFNFDARKHTLEYDDVMNHQRKVVYERRRTMLGNKLDEVETYLNTILPEAIEEVQAKVLAKKEQIGREAFLESVRRIALYVTDLLWVEHLETMEYMRSSVNLRAYGQREPLVEYKKEGLRMFREMEISYKEQLFALIETINTAPSADTQVKQTLVPEHQEGLILGQTDNKNDNNSSNVSSLSAESSLQAGRNDPCPCGSGKKYKKCHGQ